uniref:Sugar transporter BTST40 n=1 Tax=Bemisia tabaci TaxID=7038 RepID=A0A1Z1XG25_BEMTA|nr:PREDICTED: facilitated trehalose transporter Tret1-like [Bemisia tabaci]XP_018909447.1 PREDICTED: facilitated trehalose transporter Tret1-like [Bemisia tabaci]ARX98205.1 sugar transporter BTST40 [Bemisia tabaci]
MSQGDKMERGQESITMIPRGDVREEGKKLPQYIAAITATLGAVAIGTVLGWSSSASPFLKGEITNVTSTIDPPLSVDESARVESFVAIGAIMGALPAGYFADLLGRKTLIAALTLPFLLSWIMILLAKVAWLLYVARILAGIATGATCTVVPMYISEIAELSIRGTLGAYFQLMITLGIFYAYVYGYLVRFAVLNILCALIPIAGFFMFMFVPESPKYLLMRQKKQSAEKSLRWLRGNKYNIKQEIETLQNEIAKSSRTKVSFKDLVATKVAFKSVNIALGLMVFQQLSGVNAVIFNMNAIFMASGSTIEPAICSIIIGAIQVIVTFFSSILIDKAGRKILLLISLGVSTLSLGVLGYYFHLKNSGEDVSGIGFIPLICLILFIVVFSLGLGPIPWMMSGEILAAEIKGLASSLATALNWTLTFVVTRSYAPMEKTLGTDVTFWLFACICAIGFVFVVLIVPETKGKTVDQVQQLLAGKKPARKNGLV